MYDRAMKAAMSMTLDTTWGNAIELSIEAHLDNTHELMTAELARLQIDAISIMAAEVRRENERVHRIAAEESEPERRDEPRQSERS